MLIDQLRREYQQRHVVLPPYAWALKFDPNQPRGKGGKWTKGAATEVETETCEAGEPGECFRNANKWNTRHGIDTDRVVHGKVTNAEGKTFDHAWIERANGNVVDPTSGVVLPKEQYYKLLHAQPEATYTSKEAIRNQIRAMHHGPWTAADLAQKYDPDQPRGKGGRWIKERIDTFKAKYPVVAHNFPRSTHTEMGSIESHTGDVGREWDTQLTPAEMQGISERFGSDVGKLMQSAITLHDIGKAEAIESGAGKHAQHEHTIPIMQDVLTKEGFSKKDISLATELLNHDLIGPLFRGYEGFEAREADVVAKLQEKAKKVGMNVADFVTLQLAFYQADASAYPYITQFMHREPSGKWTFSGSTKIAAIEALTRVQKFDPHQLRDEKGRWTEGGNTGESGTTYLHGTAQAFIEDILKHGISGDYGGLIHPKDHAKRTLALPGHVYMTTDEAEARAYAESAGLSDLLWNKGTETVLNPVYMEGMPRDAEHTPFYESGTRVGGGLPAVLTVKLPPRVVAKLRKDKRSDILTPDSFAYGTKRVLSKAARSYKGDIKPEWITSISYMTEDLATGKKTWHTVNPKDYKKPGPTTPPWIPEVKAAAEDTVFYIPMRLHSSAKFVEVLKYSPAQPRGEHTGRWVTVERPDGAIDSVALESNQVAHDTYIAIDQYVSGNASYLNGTLRAAGQHARGEFVGRYREYPVNQEQVDLFDEHMQKNLLEEDRTFFRSVPNYVMAGLSVGDVYQDDGYVSTTMNADRIDQIRRDIGARVEAYHSVLTVQVPKGLGHIDVNKELGHDHDYSHQNEVILPRGLKFEVVSKGPGNVMTVKVVP